MKTAEIAAELGVSPQAVNKAVRRGRIQREADGTFDLAKVLATWVSNADQHQRSRGLTVKASKSKKPLPKRHDRRPEVLALEAGSMEAVDESISEAQRLEAWVKLKQRETDLLEREGKLLRSELVVSALSSMVATAKTRLRAVASHLAPQFSLGMREAECEALINAEIDEALLDLAAWQPPTQAQ